MRKRTLKVPEAVRETIRRMDLELKRKVRGALDEILLDPFCGKPLKDELHGLWSLRVGRLRVIYQPAGAGPEIVAIGPRRSIYEDTARIVFRRTKSQSR
jgi:mRNA-degrading endonuclease RelE of RelBE toxin-antitoxin system